jgi:hypothetical protein
MDAWDVAMVLADQLRSIDMKKPKKTHAQLDREIATALHARKATGKHKGDRYAGMQGAAYRQGWDDGAYSLRARQKVMPDDETLKVAIDALLEGDVERGFRLVHVQGGFDADLENYAFRDSEWPSEQKLEVRRDPTRTEELVARFRSSPRGRQYQTGYVDRVLDILEKKVGLREE